MSPPIESMLFMAVSISVTSGTYLLLSSHETLLGVAKGVRIYGT